MSGIQDPISDMLARIRNALARDKKVVEIPLSNLKKEIAKILKEEGYIEDFQTEKDMKQGILRIIFKKQKVINGIKRVSKPARRLYTSADRIPTVKEGTGICILSTSRGIFSDRGARKENVGGEILAYVW